MTLSIAPSPDVARHPLAAGLAGFGDRVAVIAADETLTYSELALRVADRAAELGPGRRLVLLAADNHLESVITYLAALSAGHPVIVVPGGAPRALAAVTDQYDPDVTYVAESGRWRLEHRRVGTAHTLHPELAVLLSTSGTTGSPKLVRLSRENIRSNAAAIADYLGLTDDDRAITSLPMHYCYGLSVVNSHLLVGAGLVLTRDSVLDESFWAAARDGGATSLAGVPYTFELLERCGFADRDLPRLRYITQAGGRMSPERVVAFAELGQRRGWDLFVMYGQTEATARMAYLPPELATTHPSSIGRAVPGGSLRIDFTAGGLDPAVGELVYSGANVMMGYAEEPADLAAGATLSELRTGDLARQHDGMFEVLGRIDRFSKLFGLRVDLDHVERGLESAGLTGRCVVADDVLHVFVDRRGPRGRTADAAASASGLPAHAVRVTRLQAIPLNHSGKVDYASLARHAAQLTADAATSRPAGGPVNPAAVRDLYAHALGRPDAGVESSFAGLGGDSLSYVELSLRLEELLGDLPSDWHTRSASSLAAGGGAPRRRPRALSVVDTSVALRALAIVLVVANHADLFIWYGGAHVLLGVAGFNFARFQLATAPGAARTRATLASLARLVVPSTIWIGAVAVATGMYRPETALFLNGVLGSPTWDVQWQFWFLEALVWTWVLAAAALSIARIGRLERRRPFAFAMALLAGGLAFRYADVGVEAGSVERYSAGVVFWCFALGWAAARARSRRQRLVVSALAALAPLGFFGDPAREATVAAGLLALMWIPSVRSPRWLAAALAVLAGSSLYVYLTHWVVYPHLEVDHPVLAVLASFAVGIAYWRLVEAVRRRAPTALPGRRRAAERALV